MTPEGWHQVRLSEVADQRTEKVVPAVADVRPYVALEHLVQGSPTLLGWSEAGTATSAKTIFHTGDVLFGKLRPYLRKAAAAPFDGLCSTDILPLFNRKTLDARYLVQLTQWYPLQQHAVATSSGTKMPRTSWKQLGEFAFSLPPPPEQQNIAAILSSVDDAIEKTQAIIGQVQIIKRGLMQELFTRGLPGQHVRFKQTEIGRIPEEWSATLGSDLFRLAGGYGPRALVLHSEGECLFIKVETLNNRANRRLVRHSAECFKEVENPKIQVYEAGSLVFPKRGAAIFKNRVRLLDAKVAVDPNLMILIPKADVDSEFFMYLLLYIGLFNLSDNSGVPQLNNKHLYPRLFPVPSLHEQQEIAKVISNSDDRITSEEDKMAALKDLKQALMSVLLTGKLRVAPDPEVA